MSERGEVNRIGCLDGLRGLAALWVLVGHAHILANFHVPVLGDPDLGVDLFIMLSGFLMVFHYQLRETKEPWEDSRTWKKFWLRRFFRIAPLYYVMLAIALAAGPMVYEARMVIDHFNGVSPQEASRYLDSSGFNFVAHLTFLFGFIPRYAFSTPLPDWSIGLEMQFYAALPIMMILVKRLGWFKAVAVSVAVSITIGIGLRMMHVQFPMPTFLPLKWHAFGAGMLCAAALRENDRSALFMVIVAFALILVPVGGDQNLKHRLVRIGLVLAVFALVHYQRLPGLAALVVGWTSRFLGNPFFHRLGELSFGAYLIHLLVMQPIIAYLINHAVLGNGARFMATLLITVPIVYLLAWLTYSFVEVPGQKLGRLLSSPPAPVAR